MFSVRLPPLEFILSPNVMQRTAASRVSRQETVGIGRYNVQDNNVFTVSSHALALNHTPVSQLSEAQHTRPKQRQKNTSSQTKPVISHHKGKEKEKNRLAHEY